MASKAYFFVLSCALLFGAVHAVDGSKCTNEMDATCNTKQALSEDAAHADGSAVELLQKKSTFKAGQVAEAQVMNETELKEAQQMLDSVINDLGKAKKSRSHIYGDKEKADYSREAVERELHQKHADAASNDTTHLQESQQASTSSGILKSYWTLVATGKWCNNKQGAVRSNRGVAAKGYTAEACQAACAQDMSCKYYGFDESDDGWCATYKECGEPTDSPNGRSQDLKKAVTYKKETEEEHVQGVVKELRKIAAEPMAKTFIADSQIKVPRLKEAEKEAYKQAAADFRKEYEEETDDAQPEVEEAKPEEAKLAEAAEPAEEEADPETKPMEEAPQAEEHEAPAEEAQMRKAPMQNAKAPRQNAKAAAKQAANAPKQSAKASAKLAAMPVAAHKAWAKMKDEEEVEEVEPVEEAEAEEVPKAKKQKRRQEFRLDHDGHAYTKQDFIDYYGDLQAWDRAPEAHMKHLKQRHDIVHDVFEAEGKDTPAAVKAPSTAAKSGPQDGKLQKQSGQGQGKGKGRGQGAAEAQPSQVANKFNLLAEGKWCDNQGTAVKDASGVHDPGYSLDKCKEICTASSTCEAISYNKLLKWCTTYSICGTPTTNPNNREEDTSDWLVFEKAGLADAIAESEGLEPDEVLGEAETSPDDVASDDDSLKWEKEGYKKVAEVKPEERDLKMQDESVVEQQEYATAGDPLPEDTQDPASEASEDGATATCKTVKGTACIFPFVFKGMAFDKCTYTDTGATGSFAWCATTYANAAWLSGQIPDGEWGQCSPECEDDKESLIGS